MCSTRNKNEDVFKTLALAIIAFSFLGPIFLSHLYLDLTGEYGDSLSERGLLLLDALSLAQYVFLAIISCVIVGVAIAFCLRKNQKEINATVKN
jgi:hypothetical protein